MSIPGDVAVVPPVVTEQAELVRVAGLTPEVERINSRRWRVSVTTDRVHAFAEYKADRLGRFAWTAGKLTVDGKDRPTAPPVKLAEIVRDPDAYLAAALVDIPPMPAAREVEEAPPAVRHAYAILNKGLGGKVLASGTVLTPRLGRSETGRWIIGFDFNETSCLRVTYERFGKARWGMASKRPIRLIVFGDDRSREVKEDLGKAIALALAGLAAEPTSSTPAVNSPSAAAQSNSVTVRKATVIRV